MHPLWELTNSIFVEFLERAGAGGAAAGNTHGACNDHLGAEVVAANAVGVACGCLEFFFFHSRLAAQLLGDLNSYESSERTRAREMKCGSLIEIS